MPRQNVRLVGLVDRSAVNVERGDTSQALLECARDQAFVEALEQLPSPLVTRCSLPGVATEVPRTGRPCAGTTGKRKCLMDSDDYRFLLQHIRRSAREAQRTDLDERLRESRWLDDRREPEDEVEAYLLALRQELISGSDRVAREVLGRFARVSTVSGAPISGVVVDVQEEDRVADEPDEIDLVGSRSLDQVIVQLDDLLREIATDRGTR